MITSTGLDNVEVGGQWNNAVSIRFLAKTSAPLSAIRLYWIIKSPKSGYASGNGGTFAYELCIDQNGAPGPALTTQPVVIQNNFTQNGQGNFPLVCFVPVMLTAGAYYHVVVRNVDANPKQNWSSLDFLSDEDVLNQTPDVQILVSAQGVAWESVDGGELAGSPVALFYADGTIQGYGWYQVGKNGVLLGGEAYGFPASICQ